MILLIRHCTPKINYSRCSYVEAERKIQDYNTTNNIAIEEIKPFYQYLKQHLSKRSIKIFSSPLPRSFKTAQELFNNKDNIHIEDLFIEFDLKLLPIPFIKLKFKTWLMISRLAWFLGLLKTSRSFLQERRRAKKCADILHDAAQQGSVILVAHGLLNAFIENI